jgi:arylsulfatase A-like enzyme
VRKLLDSPWFYFGLAAALAIAAVASQFKLQIPSRSKESADAIAKLRDRDDLNVIFVLVDTLRADHLAAYGYDRPTTPVMSDLASVGIRFANVEAQSSWTKTSMASLWTAALPSTAGVLRYPDAISDAVTMPAEILTEAGLRTAGIFRNEWLAPNFGFGQGFGLYGRPAPSQTQEKLERRSPWMNQLQGNDFDATEAAIEFLRSYRKERFFLYVHYMDVHQYMYAEGSDLFGTRYIDAYDNAIHWVDRNIGMMLAEVDALDILDKTVVVIASDHGEGFGEHGMEGHARNLYREVTHVPLIVSLPFRLDEPIVVEPRVRNMDIWPTVLDLLGLPAIPESEGISLLPLVEATAAGKPVDALAPETSYGQLDRTWGRIGADPDPLIALSSGLNGKDRLIYPATGAEKPELYDLAIDPGELENLAEKEPARIADGSAKIGAYLAAKPAKSRAIEIPVDEINLVQLKALGYVISHDEKKEVRCDPTAPGADCPKNARN